MSVKQRAYIGDGVYASFDGYDLELVTSDGLRETNRIILEPEVLVSLLAWLEKTRTELRAQGWRG